MQAPTLVCLRCPHRPDHLTDYAHETINHSSDEYVRVIETIENGNPKKVKVHTNGIENFWSLFKRGIDGIYHQVSPKHLHRYCDEYAYRYNNKGFCQAEKFNIAVVQADGHRLSHKALIAPKP